MFTRIPYNWPIMSAPARPPTACSERPSATATVCTNDRSTVITTTPAAITRSTGGSNHVGFAGAIRMAFTPSRTASFKRLVCAKGSLVSGVSLGDRCRTQPSRGGLHRAAKWCRREQVRARDDGCQAERSVLVREQRSGRGGPPYRDSKERATRYQAAAGRPSPRPRVVASVVRARTSLAATSGPPSRGNTIPHVPQAVSSSLHPSAPGLLIASALASAQSSTAEDQPSTVRFNLAPAVPPYHPSSPAPATDGDRLVPAAPIHSTSGTAAKRSLITAAASGLSSIR